jgi:hypothetical protein
LSTRGCFNGTKCARVRYSEPGTGPYWFGKKIDSYNLSEIYVKFYFKVVGPSGGAKFLKIFGEPNDPEGYANTTFAIKYHTGSLSEISYGDGTSKTNDTQHIIKYDGKTKDEEVNIIHSTDQIDIADGNWHLFKAHIKYNRNGKRDGVYRVWVDGVLRVHAENIKNRNDRNSMNIRSVDLANYSPSNNNWELWYDEIVISTKSDSTGAELSPPTGLKILQ